MDGEHSWAVDLAKELLDDNGKTMVFYRETPAVPGPLNQPWRPNGINPSTPTTYTVIGLTVPYDEKMIDGESIRRSDVRCYVAAKGMSVDYVPTANDYVTMGGVKYKVIGASPLEPGTERILYDIQLRA